MTAVGDGSVVQSAPVASDTPARPDDVSGPAGERRLRPTDRGPWAIWVVGAASLGLVGLDAVLFAWHHGQVDMAVYLMGGHHAFDGSLYQVLLASPRLSFTYPPFAALVFAPLTLLPTSIAQVVVGIASAIALGALICLSIHAAVPGLGRRSLLAWSLVWMAPALWLEPVGLTFALGQVNVLIAAAVLGDLTVDFKFAGRTAPRGLVLGVVAAVKLTPLIFIPYLFITRQIRAACVVLGTFAVCTAAMVAVNPTGSWTYWTKDVFDAARVGGAYYVSNQSLRAVIDRADHEVASTLIVAVLGVVVAALGLALAAWAFRSSSNLLGVLVCATTGLLVSPITWAHHLVWVVPVAVWLAAARDRPRGGRIWATALALLFWVAPIWWVSDTPRLELSETWWQWSAGSSYFIAVVVFELGVALMLTTRSARARRVRLRLHPQPPGARLCR